VPEVNWSSWVTYLDTDDDGRHPTLDAFTESTGITVNLREDVNDNAEFDAKVRPQLQAGQDIDRDLVVLSDWMVAKWISDGFAQRFDRAWVPNARNLLPRMQAVPYDPERDQSLPWQAGYTGLGFNSELLKELTGKSEIRTIAELWDPALRGRVTVLAEMRDTVGVVMLGQDNDPASFTSDDFNSAIAELQVQLDSGQIRQVTGNDYIAALENGDVIAVIGWSGDVFALGDKYGFNLPESGGTLWTDNMLVPALAAHKKNAELAMNYYYEPAVAAKVAEYVQYICPVEGAQAEMEKIDPELASSPYIFPTDAELSNSYVFMELTPEQQEQYERAFQKAIGN
jgi:spermidine/putrescine transport system substrate-binding protein